MVGIGAVYDKELLLRAGFDHAYYLSGKKIALFLNRIKKNFEALNHKAINPVCLSHQKAGPAIGSGYHTALSLSKPFVTVFGNQRVHGIPDEFGQYDKAV